jgi:hypothetical protein
MAAGKAGKPLAPALVYSAACEVIEHGWDVRHLVCPGKEVMESAPLLLRIAEAYHAAPSHKRPGSLGIITASASGLGRYGERLAETPLTWTAISMDAVETGLRTPGNNDLLFKSALEFKASGGTELLGVNTLLTEVNLETVLEIGRGLLRRGVDQWTLSPLLRPAVNGRMESVVPKARLDEITERIVLEFGGKDLEIVFDHIDLAPPGGDLEALLAGQDRWRVEYKVPGAANVTLITGNARPGYFVRLDYTGQLMSKEDFRRIGRSGCYGPYAPGRFAALLEELRGLRCPAACAA